MIGIRDEAAFQKVRPCLASVLQNVYIHYGRRRDAEFPQRSNNLVDCLLVLSIEKMAVRNPSGGSISEKPPGMYNI